MEPREMSDSDPTTLRVNIEPDQHSSSHNEENSEMEAIITLNLAEQIEFQTVRLLKMYKLNEISTDEVIEFKTYIETRISQTHTLLTKPKKKSFKLIKILLSMISCYLDIINNTKDIMISDETIEHILDSLRISTAKYKKKHEQEASIAQKTHTNYAAVTIGMQRLVQGLKIQDYTASSLCQIMFDVLEAEKDSFLSLPAMNLIASIISCYPVLRSSIMMDVIGRIPNDSAALKKMQAKTICLDKELELSLDVFLALHVVQSATYREDLFKKDGELNYTGVIDSYEDSMQLCMTYIAEIIKRTLKYTRERSDTRSIFNFIIEELLKARHRPELPAAIKILSFITIEMFNQLSNTHCNLNMKNFLIEKIGEISSAFRKDIRSVRENPIIPSNILKSRKTKHPKEDPLTSLCVCKKGWSNARSRMLQCESCFKWFHYDCIGVNKDNKTDEEWNCDDCLISKHLKGKLKEGNKHAIEIVNEDIDYVTSGFDRVFRELVNNYLVSVASARSSRFFFMSTWLTSILANEASETDDKLLEHVSRCWAASEKKSEFVKLSEAGTVKLYRQLIVYSESGPNYYLLQNKLLYLLGSSQALTRVRALKSLANIVEVDSLCLSNPHLREAIFSRLRDPSIAVREAALDLLSKCLQDELVTEHFQSILDRLKDRGSSVRLRVVRLLKRLIETQPDHERLVEILSELAMRANDETPSIKEAVIAVFSSSWLCLPPRSFLSNLVKVMRLLPSGDHLIQLFKGIKEKSNDLMNKLREVVNESMNQLIATDNPEFSMLFGKILEVIANVDGSLLMDAVPTLHHFLIPRYHTEEEHELIRCVCVVIEKAAKLGARGWPNKDIEKELLKLVYTQGAKILTASANALVVLVMNGYRDTQILSQLLTQCFIIMKASLEQQHPQERLIPSIQRALFTFGYVIHLLPYDVLDLMKIEYEKLLSESILDIYVSYCNSSISSIRDRALEGLSYTWIKMPAILPKCFDILKEFFSQAQDSDKKVGLLYIFHRLLSRVLEMINEGQVVDSGNIVSGFSLFLENFLSLALDEDVQVREVGVEVVRLLSQVGNLNPSLIIPTAAALLGDNSTFIRDAASNTIMMLASKNPDLLLVNVKQIFVLAYEFQKKIKDQPRAVLPSGESLYGKFMELLSNKKSLKMRLVSKLVKHIEEVQDYSLSYFLIELMTCISFSSPSELRPLLSYIDSKIESQKHRILHLCKHYSDLEDNDKSQVEIFTQIVALKNYFTALYQIKGEQLINKLEDAGPYNEWLLEFSRTNPHWRKKLKTIANLITETAITAPAVAKLKPKPPKPQPKDPSSPAKKITMIPKPSDKHLPATDSRKPRGVSTKTKKSRPAEDSDTLVITDESESELSEEDDFDEEVISYDESSDESDESYDEVPASTRRNVKQMIPLSPPTKRKAGEGRVSALLKRCKISR